VSDVDEPHMIKQTGLADVDQTQTITSLHAPDRAGR
jgi:hypothetical protein